MNSLRKAIGNLRLKPEEPVNIDRRSEGLPSNGGQAKEAKRDSPKGEPALGRQPVAECSASSSAASGEAKAAGVPGMAGGDGRCTKRLMKEFQDMAKLKDSEMTAELVDDNLFEWDVCLWEIDPDSSLHKDMTEQAIDCVRLRFDFPASYPFHPPFVRVISPYIQGGYVMEGGAICMELLTLEGWSGLYTVEAVVRQFSASLIRGRARLARKAKGRAYTKANAEASFKALVRTHQKRGWYTPPKEEG